MPHQPVALWKDRLLRFAMGASATTASAAVSVVRNKWLATHLETTGLGVLAQVLSAQTWLGSLAGMGLGLPVARAVGSAGGVGDEARARRVIWTAFSLAGLGGLTIAGAGLLLAQPISQALLGSPSHAGLVRISMLGVLAFALQVVLQGIFAGRSDLRANLTLALCAGVTALAVTLALVPRLGLTGGVLGAAALPLAGVVGALYFHQRVYAAALLPAPRPLLEAQGARGIAGVGAATLILTLADLGSLVALRAHYLREHGVAANGLLQAALALSQQTGALFYAYLSSYAFGKVSAAAGAGGTAAIRDYTRRQWAPLMLLAALVVAVAMVAATPLLHLLYSSRFDAARPLMAWALFGEFCRVGMNAWGLGSLPLGGARLWLPIGLSPAAGTAAAYVALAWTSVGAERLALAYAAGCAFSLLFAAVAMGRRGVTPTARGAAAVLISTLALAALAAWVAR